MSKLPSSTPEEAVEHPLVGGPVRLGKLAVKKDKRNLKFASYLPRKAALPAIPKSLERSHLVQSWPMYGNDRLGDCTCAAVGHIDQLVSAAGGAAETVPDQDVLDLYWATGTQDDGRYCLDVLNRWVSPGFASGAAAEKILAFVQINPKNYDHLKLAMLLFGNVYVGLALPLSAQTQTVWQNASSKGPKIQPGSWGGHCVPYFDFTRTRIRCVTWGQTLELTWGFHMRYCDEAYAVISPDWIKSGQAPADAGGYKLDELQADLAALGG